MLLQVRNQFRDQAEAGCTSVSLSAGTCASCRAVVAQNWDNDPELDSVTIVLTRRPEGRPAVMNVTQAGLIGYIGFSEAGIGMCLTTLPAPGRDVGVPHYFTVRAIHEAGSLAEAVQAVRRAHRAIPANILLATPQGPADLEVTIDDVHVLTDRSGRLLTHTNHALHADLAHVNALFPELIQSYPRKTRIDSLIAARAGELDLEQVKQALRDHENHPRSICRHPNDDQGTGFWSTVFSVIIEPEARRMHVSRGNPCLQPYEAYCLN
jgi:isopenicillin-N N-acyltransferase-like protein